MKIKEVKIEHFKRFTDLTVSQIPETARLIVLVGPNGCGKSSFFEALNTWHRHHGRGSRDWQEGYHTKVGSPPAAHGPNNIKITFHSNLPQEANFRRKIFYIRSAYRNEADFVMAEIQRADDPLNHAPVQRLVDNDAAVSRNYRRMVGQSIETLYGDEQGEISLSQFRTNMLEEIRNSLLRLFPDLKLVSMGNPTQNGTFLFDKGHSRRFRFQNLSGGEKAVFDLVLDLSVAKHAYDNTIFCIDEPDAHMNARLQSRLLRELYRSIPQGCQLIVATHSIGMMREARDIKMESPHEVVFLNFEGRNFDDSVTITPAFLNREFWGKIHQVALDDLAKLVAPEQVVICEGEPKNKVSGDNFAHDARCLDIIFREDHPETQFIPGGGIKDVLSDKRGIGYAVGVLSGATRQVRLVDRDEQTDGEVNQLQ